MCKARLIRGDVSFTFYLFILLSIILFQLDQVRRGRGRGGQPMVKTSRGDLVLAFPIRTP